jgi:hypothetical protein
MTDMSSHALHDVYSFQENNISLRTIAGHLNVGHDQMLELKSPQVGFCSLKKKLYFTNFTK